MSLNITKYSIYLLYLIGQILLFSTLMTIGMTLVSNLIFMLLAIIFYFVLALKNPGVYQSQPTENLQDKTKTNFKNKSLKKCSNRRIFDENQTEKIQNKISQFLSEKSKNNRMKDFKEHSLDDKIKNQTNQIGPQSQLRENQDIKRQQSQNYSHQLGQPKTFNQKGAQFKGLQKNIQENQKRQIEKITNQEIKSQNFLSAAKNIFFSVKNILSKKDIERENSLNNERENNDENSKDFKRNETNEKQENKSKLSEMICIPDNREYGDTSLYIESCYYQKQIDQDQQVEKQNGVPILTKKCFKTSPELHSMNMNTEEIMQTNINTALTPLKERLKNIKRYCRICQIYQPLRVRHCHDCEKCISTFDHHCSWINNCIGQKNKIFFLVYLLFQSLQLLAIQIDLVRQLSRMEGEAGNKVEIMALFLCVLVLLVMVCGLFGYHLSLVALNLTTWENLRWNRIQYLKIFCQKDIKSLFNRNCKHNFILFFTYSKSSSRIIWEEQVFEENAKFLLKQSSTQMEDEVMDVENGETSRKFAESHRVKGRHFDLND